MIDSFEFCTRDVFYKDLAVKNDFLQRINHCPCCEDQTSEQKDKEDRENCKERVLLSNKVVVYC